MKPDLVAYDKDGQLAVVVEVKNKAGTNKDWAAKMRRNMYAHGFWPKARYFLLALPDRFYLWKNAGNLPEIVDPDYEIDATRVLKPYYERTGFSTQSMSGSSFELLVASWLNEVMQGDIAPHIVQQNQDWLVDSGLLESLKEGQLAPEAEI